MLSSTYKGFMAGIACIAVALFVGFGGGVLIAEWLNSETAIPKQSRIEKARAPDPNPEAATSPKPEAPAAKSVQGETVEDATGSALAASPHSPAPLSSAPPAAAASATAISPAVPSRGAGSVAQSSAASQPQREVIREHVSTPSGRPVLPQAQQPQPPNSQAQPAKPAREPERSARHRPEPRPDAAKPKETRKQAARLRSAETTGTASRERAADADYADDDVIEAGANDITAGRGGKRAQRRDRREVTIDEEVVQYRSAPRSPVPFIPFFSR